MGPATNSPSTRRSPAGRPQAGSHGISLPGGVAGVGVRGQPHGDTADPRR